MMSDPSTSSLHVIEALPWLRLSPPVIAITLAIACRDVNFSLLLATFSGCLLLSGFDIPAGVGLLCDIMVDQVADADHASVILFTILLGAMIGLMNDSGGTRSVVDRMTHYANTRRKGQVLTWLAGLVVFFDDYANTMLIGGSMRPLSDKLRFSRAKLAFLIDATAAPVAGMALSTWTAFEIDQVRAGLVAAGVAADPGSIFFATIPFRIYPILAIITVGAIAISGRDFGTMLRAEEKMQASAPVASTSPEESSGGHAWLAVVPVVVLVATVLAGYLRGVDAYRLLLVASLAASTTAAVLPMLARVMTIGECSRSWSEGITSMIPAIIVLVLAWGISDVCGANQSDPVVVGELEAVEQEVPENPGGAEQTESSAAGTSATGPHVRLRTAGYIISLVGDRVQAEFLPCIAFLAAGAIAVSIGSSFTTMALLIPLFIPLALSLTVSPDGGGPSVDSPVFLATVGAILAGAIFGDHCSPISDTTVLSSAAAGCDHLQHVSTQLPYAILMAASSLLLGYLPIGFGLAWWIALPMCAVASVSAVMLFGKEPVRDESVGNGDVP